jgi:hypothetical protein
MDFRCGGTMRPRPLQDKAPLAAATPTL